MCIKSSHQSITIIKKMELPVGRGFLLEAPVDTLLLVCFDSLRPLKALGSDILLCFFDSMVFLLFDWIQVGI